MFFSSYTRFQQPNLTLNPRKYYDLGLLLLAPEENAFLQEKLQNLTIQSTPGICGSHARIRNTRIPVWTIISLSQQGDDTNELLRNYPSLMLSDLSATWVYYNTHKEEIDNLIASHNEDDE